jgi:acetylornithine/N-succinyldiaminopimelate aminotransferase
MSGGDNKISNQSIKAMTEQYVLGTYAERHVALVRGEGPWVWDADGNRYFDSLCGIGVNNLGHCHPKVVEALRKQAATLLHVSNIYLIEPQARLAKLLCDNTFAAKVFFANSGAEAVEGCLKLARHYALKKGHEDKKEIITLEHSFHGRTFGAMTATGQEKYRKGFDPLVPGFKYGTLNNLDSIKSRVDEKTCAIALEPIQGEGGIRPATEEFLKGVRQLCDENDMLLIFDEVQCGNGRTGYLYAHQEWGIEPDLLATAKGLGAGVPIGAFLVSPRCEQVFGPGNHATTFGGNPLATAAGVAAIEALLEEGFLENVRKLSKKAFGLLNDMAGRVEKVQEIRGRGLMIGVQINEPAAPYMQKMMDRGYLVGVAGPQVIRLLPPLIIEEEQLEQLINTLEEVLSE